MKTKDLNTIKELFYDEFTTWYCDIPADWYEDILYYASESVERLLENIDDNELLRLLQEMVHDKKHEMNEVVIYAARIAWTDDETWVDYKKLLETMIEIVENQGSK